MCFVSGKKSVPKKPEVNNVIDLDALAKDTASPNYVLFPFVEANRNENALTPFKTTHSGLMGVAVKEMPTNEVTELFCVFFTKKVCNEIKWQ